MRKKWIAVSICLFMAASAAGCSVAPAEGEQVSSDSPSSETVSDVSSEPLSSEPLSSEAPESQIPSSETPSSKAVSSQPPATAKLQTRPTKEPRSTNWSAKLLPYGTESEDAPVYPLSAESVAVVLNAGDGYVEKGAPHAIYRLEGKNWVLLNSKAANAKTEADFAMAETSSLIGLDTTGYLTKAGKYKVELQFDGKLVSFPFTVDTKPAPPLDDLSWVGEPASTNWSAKLEKETYPIGTESINFILSSGNGVIDSGNTFCLYRLEGEEWKTLFNRVPATIASPMKPETTMTIPFDVKGLLDTAGTYKVTRYLGGDNAEVTFTVE